MDEELTPEEQARRDKRWRMLSERAPAGAGPLGAVIGMISPAAGHTIQEAQRQRESGATLAASGRRLDLDLDKGTVVIRPGATSEPDDEGGSPEA